MDEASDTIPKCPLHILNDSSPITGKKMPSVSKNDLRVGDFLIMMFRIKR